MDEDEIVGGDIAREDVIDAIAEVENEDAPLLLTEFYVQETSQDKSIERILKVAKMCAEMLMTAKRYEEVNIWLDEIATKVSDEYGPDSETYMAFTEDEELETIRMNATDRALGEEEEDDYDLDDE